MNPTPLLKNITSSDKNVFYETELFPALLMRNWAPVHVHVFHNGKVLLTGVKTLSHAHHILHELKHELNSLEPQK